MMDTEKLYKCAHCGEMKPLSGYYVRKSGKQAGQLLSKWCKACYSARSVVYNRRYRALHPKLKKERIVMLSDGRAHHIIPGGRGNRGGKWSLYWSETELDYLKRNFATTKNEDLALYFRCSVRTLTRKAHELGLKKSKAWMLRNQREVLKRIHKERRYFGNWRKRKER